MDEMPDLGERASMRKVDDVRWTLMEYFFAKLATQYYYVLATDARRADVEEEMEAMIAEAPALAADMQELANTFEEMDLVTTKGEALANFVGLSEACDVLQRLRERYGDGACTAGALLEMAEAHVFREHPTYRGIASRMKEVRSRYSIHRNARCSLTDALWSVMKALRMARGILLRGEDQRIDAA